ncbi:MAG TPA: hypothetical protein VJ021_00335 [Thermoplasmata archaeon]|nr:hypothetical protein [Thermoplasmata archaeon]
MGSVSSSRLTRILQEKAEALKKQRQSAEVTLKEIEDQVAKLDQLGITPAEVPERQQALRELARRADWNGVESQAKALTDYLSKTVPTTIQERRARTAESIRRFSGLGLVVPADVGAELDALARPPEGEAWAETVGRLARVEESLHESEMAHVNKVRERALAVATWAGLTGARLGEFEKRLDDVLLPAKEDRLAEAFEGVDRLLRAGLPESAERRQKVRDEASRLVVAAKEFGAPTSRLEAALDAGTDATPDRWPEVVPATEAAIQEVGEALRDRCVQILEALRTSLDSTGEYGVDPTSARLAVDDALARIRTSPPLEIGPIFLEARRAAEEPIVTVVAGLLDEARPRIADARRLGRDPSEVFAAMNRAREALRLKIYSEAFAASQEALDKVSRLTEELDTARDELQSLEEMAARFRKTGFSIEPFDPALLRIRASLDRAEVGPAREVLKETVVHLGREALQFFIQRWASLDKARDYARERQFLSPDADRDMNEARELLDKGELAESAERISRAETELRRAAAPYVARRVEEMEQGLSDIPDEALVAPVRRLLADADVTLRVKQDLIGSVESLRRAEREFGAVVASHASALVEILEAERAVLEGMGGPSDEIQRQIDEVQQIFNMGDFVKASRASQEIRTRAQQQQLLRSEESVSHAKLSLVELETMGFDLAKFRGQLDEAQSAARAARFADAYRLATRLEESALRARASGQAILEGIARAQEMLGHLREAGVDPNPYYEPLRNARLAFQSLDFDRARATLEEVERKLGEEAARGETTHLLGEVEHLIEDGRRLSSPMEPFQARWEQLRTEQATAPPEATRTGARLLHDDLIAILRPVLDENLRTLERDLDIARSAGVDLDKILLPLGEARRRIALPVPIGAAALLDAARAEFVSTRGFVEHAERVAKRAREALAEADLLHVHTAALREQMERIEKLLADRQYARVVELGGPLERELIQATYQHVSKTLAGFQATVTRLRKEGIDTSLAENLLHRARMALDEGRPVEALQLAGQSEGELERADLQRRIAEGSIVAAEAAVARATQEGVISPVAAEELASAKLSFQGHEYPPVLEHALLASDALGIAREGHRRARDAISAGERQLREASEVGAATDSAKVRLEQARHHLESGLYPDATRAGRESVEEARWAIERLFAGPLGELRRQLESTRREGLAAEVDPIEAIVGEAETALRAREWARVKEAIARGEAASVRIIDAVVDGRWREAEAEYLRASDVPPAEVDRRAEVRTQLTALRSRHDFAAALGLVRSELDLARRRRREEIERQMAEFKDRLWVGERLALDTTPVMQTFSEARVALDAGRPDEAEALLARATSALEPTVREPYTRRWRELQTEVNFAQEGLHVRVGPIRERLYQVEQLDRSGQILDAARLLLKIEEDLNLRKSLHRELMNLHYLIDAALTRAHELRVDTSEARALLAESLRLRETDYAAALEKAREALRKLQSDGVGTPEGVSVAPAPAANPFWPFRRPPSEP